MENVNLSLTTVVLARLSMTMHTICLHIVGTGQCRLCDYTVLITVDFSFSVSIFIIVKGKNTLQVVLVNNQVRFVIF